jgi:large subunit ribosomal protein L25
LEKIELKATIRKTVGNGPARELRRQGMIPAVLYGPKSDPIILSVVTRELEHIVKSGNIGQMLLNLVIHNGKKQSKTAMIKELQTQPVSGALLHIDFYEVAMDQKIKISIPVVTTGEAVGVDLGGVLQIVRHEVDVFCYPNNIPESIEVDISNMDIGDSLHIGDVFLDEAIELADESNFTVVTVLSPKVEEEEEEEEEELEEGEEAEAEDAGEEDEPGSSDE